ncbi:hypothetical protein SCANM63S_05392 [Streptomyces canarius]
MPDVVLDRLRRGLSARLDDARDRLAENDDTNGTGGTATVSADRVYRQLAATGRGRDNRTPAPLRHPSHRGE